MGRHPAWARYFLCGVLTGAGAILPGVSGGTLAVLFGVYRPLMELLSHPKQAMPRYWRMFVPLGIGWGTGFLIFAKGLAAVMEQSASAAAWLFIGLIAGTLPALFREAGREGRAAASWTSLFLCAAGTLGGLCYLRFFHPAAVEPGPFWYAVCGALWGTSVVIPGLTTSPILMALGLYQPILEELSAPNPAAWGISLCAMGITLLSLARGMSWLLRRHNSVVLHGMTGIVCASTAAMIPVSRIGAGELVLSMVCGGAGFLLARAMERLDRHT